MAHGGPFHIPNDEEQQQRPEPNAARDALLRQFELAKRAMRAQQRAEQQKTKHVKNHHKVQSQYSSHKK